MRKTLHLALAGILALGLVACEQRTDRTDGGGVIISFGDVITWAAAYSAGASFAAGAATIEQVQLVSFPRDPNAVTSNLMNVEMHSYEVSFRRADTGTRLPPVLVFSFSGALPVNGTLTIMDMPFLLDSQLGNPPLSDLLAVNGGIDTETGADSILLDVTIVFFGRTLSGDEVESPPLQQTVQIGR